MVVEELHRSVIEHTVRSERSRALDRDLSRIDRAGERAATTAPERRRGVWSITGPERRHCPAVTQSWIRGGSNSHPSSYPNRPRCVLRLGRSQAGTKSGRQGQEARRKSRGWGRGGPPPWRRSALPDGSPSNWPADTRSHSQFLKGYTLRFVSGPGVARKGVDGWPHPR